MTLRDIGFGIAAGIALIATAPAQAATINQTITFGPGLTDYSGTGPGAQSLNFFDTSLGRLDSVTLVATYGFNSTITVFNIGASASSGTVRTESAAAFRSTDAAVDAVFRTVLDQLGAVTVGGITLDPAAFDLLGTTRSYTLAPGDSANVISNAATTTFAPGPFSDAASLAAFSSSGGGQFLAQLFTATGTLLSNTGGNSSASQSTTATGTIRIAYDYTIVPAAVPESTTWAMMIVGVGAIGAGMRRSVRARKVAFAG